MGFYDIHKPVDMFRKLEREHARLPGDSSDLFNFFVTAAHIKDYLKKSRPDDLDVDRGNWWCLHRRA